MSKYKIVELVPKFRGVYPPFGNPHGWASPIKQIAQITPKEEKQLSKRYNIYEVKCK